MVKLLRFFVCEYWIRPIVMGILCFWLEITSEATLSECMLAVLLHNYLLRHYTQVGLKARVNAVICGCMFQWSTKLWLYVSVVYEAAVVCQWCTKLWLYVSAVYEAAVVCFSGVRSCQVRDERRDIAVHWRRYSRPVPCALLRRWVLSTVATLSTGAQHCSSSLWGQNYCSLKIHWNVRSRHLLRVK